MTFVIVSPDGTMRQVESMDGESSDGKAVYATDRLGNPETERFDVEQEAWVPDVDAVRARALAEIDRQREAAQASVLTPGAAKSMIYAQKVREVANWRRMDPEERGWAVPATSFPAASAEAEATGEDLEVVMNRIGAAADAATCFVYRIEALAVTAKAAVRAAASVEEIATAADVDWGDPA